MDFTQSQYKRLIISLKEAGYQFIKFEDLTSDIYKRSHFKVAIMRHDVDKLPEVALEIARIENALNVVATYYFRTVKSVFNTDIIRQIAKHGHEIGYHYEDLDSAFRKLYPTTGGRILKSRHYLRYENDLNELINSTVNNGKNNLIKVALESFKNNLQSMREIYPVKTICMHGSPLSPINNLDLWKQINYRDLGILLEPYIDIDYKDFFYLTDTGRSWNSDKGNIRDRIKTGVSIRVKNTEHLIHLINYDRMPDKLIINTHPQRWLNPGYRWFKELIFQTIKNRFKSALKLIRS